MGCMPALLDLNNVVPGDRQSFEAINSFARHTALLHTPMLDYANYGVVLFAGLLLVGWWVARSTGQHTAVAAALWTPLGALAALAINQPIVNGVREARPYAVLPSMLLLAHRSSDYSFPSDHAVMAGAVAGGLFLVDRRLGVVAALAALLMAFARVYIGAHWPGDVEVGLVLGAAITIGGFKALERPGLAVVGFFTTTPLRPLFVAGDDHETGPEARGDVTASEHTSHDE
jgi:membrane-associated phospholipid phosphatase